MSEITISLFEQAIARYFEPIAKTHQWPLVRADEKTYEITALHFLMRIRFGTGHGRSISATLKPTSQNSSKSDTGRIEFGVAVIAGYNGVEMKTRQVSTIDEFVQQAQYVAEMANKFCVPYLLGQKPRSDFDAIGAYIEKKSEGELQKIKSYKFPPNVQKRWHLPPSNFPDKKN